MITAAQIRSFRRRAGGLDERRPCGVDALGHAMLAGASDSMPRGELLSLHARLDGVTPTALDDPLLTQVWGPRFDGESVGTWRRAEHVTVSPWRSLSDDERHAIETEAASFPQHLARPIDVR